MSQLVVRFGGDGLRGAFTRLETLSCVVARDFSEGILHTGARS